MDRSSFFIVFEGMMLGILVAMSGTAHAAPPIDWSDVPVNNVTLFYPGQSSFQWLQSRQHPGARMVERGNACVRCHRGSERQMGSDIVSGGHLEPEPIEGKKGSLDLAVQAAHDDENLYLRFQWETQANRPGAMHNYMRYNGSSWEFLGGPRSADRVRSGKEPPLYEDRLALMVDDGSVAEFGQQGCWLSCHDGMRDMPAEPARASVQAHPRLGSGGLDRTDVRKYLPHSRTDQNASWDRVEPADVIAEIRESGRFVDLMQWRAARSNPVGMADDGYVLEYRLFDEGQGPFSWNVNRKTMTPKYMFDPDRVGRKSLTVADIREPSGPVAMIREENAIPYDPDAGWKKDDVLPGRLLSRADASGSAADNDQVRGTWADGAWTVVWVRELDTGHDDDIALRVGDTYNFGFAVHDDNVTTRFHFVSFPLTVGIGTRAEITAVTLD